jgi:hypothetical protein
VCFGVLIDLLQHIGGQGDIHAHGFWLLSLERKENRDTAAVVRIGHDLFQRQGLWDDLSVFHQTFDMKGECFLGHRPRVVESRTCGDHARKVREGDAEVAASILVDQTDIVPHSVISALGPTAVQCVSGSRSERPVRDEGRSRGPS